MVGFSSSLEIDIDFPFFYVEKNLIGEIFREQFFLPLKNIFFVAKRNLIRSDMLSTFVPHPVSGVLLRCTTSSDVANTHTRGIVYLLTGKK